MVRMKDITKSIRMSRAHQQLNNTALEYDELILQGTTSYLYLGLIPFLPLKYAQPYRRPSQTRDLDVAHRGCTVSR